MSESEEKDGWREWSKHILNALTRLDKQIETLRDELNKANLDIVKLGFIANALQELETKISNVKDDINSQNGIIKEIVKSLEEQEKIGVEKLENQIGNISNSVTKLDEFATKTKTVGWIIGGVIMALIGMLSFSINELFGK